MRATSRAFFNFLTLLVPGRCESIPMQLKNLSNEVALLLPDDLLWSDEHAWSPAVASTSYLITGALLIQSATRQAGRPITLVGAPDMAWVTRATVEQLRAWSAIPVGNNAGRFVLSLNDGRQRSRAGAGHSGPGRHRLRSPDPAIPGDLRCRSNPAT